MQAAKVLILVDNPLRDLPACILLAGELSTNCRVYLSPTAQAAQEIFRLNPDLVLLNYLRDTNLPLVRKLAESEIPFSILDTEGGIFMPIPGTKETSYTMTLIKDAKLREKVEQVFCWGENLSKVLKEKSAYPSDRIFCLGTPRMDFYHSSFLPYLGDLQKLKQELTGQNKPVILLNTSFAGNNPKFSNRAAELEMLITKFGYERKFMSDFLDKMDMVMEAYIRLTQFLAKAFPQVHFVLRPHPFESFDPYTKALSPYPNVQVDCSKTVVPWILISEALIHYECSTALEAAFAGKPSLALGEFKNIRPVEAIQQVTEYAESFEDMKIKVSQVLNKNFSISSDQRNSLAKIEKSIYFKVDGHAYKRISEVIFAWFSTRNQQASLSTAAKRYANHVFFSLRTLAKFLVKGQLLPESKKLNLQEAMEICEGIGRVTRLSLKASSIPLSTSIEISRRS